MTPEEKEITKEDLREVLTGFWLEVIESQAVDVTDKLKASENLAKYILGDGKKVTKRASFGRPSTLEVLKLAAQIEEKANGTNDN